MLDWLSGFKLAPFLLMTVNGKSPALNVTRIAEAVVIAILTAAVTMYGTVQVVTTKLEHLEKDVAKLGSMAEEAIRVQQSIVPMRNLQVKTLQDEMLAVQARLKALEARK